MEVSDNVEIGELVTFDPNIRAIQPITYAGGGFIQEDEKSDLHEPDVEEPQLYLGPPYSIEFVVQVGKKLSSIGVCS